MCDCFSEVGHCRDFVFRMSLLCMYVRHASLAKEILARGSNPLHYT